MQSSSVEKVTEALAAAKARGDDKLILLIRRDINVAMLTFDQIVAKHKL